MIRVFNLFRHDYSNLVVVFVVLKHAGVYERGVLFLAAIFTAVGPV